jgi:uncharacterized phage protein (TIGR02220 family)
MMTEERRLRAVVATQSKAAPYPADTRSRGWFFPLDLQRIRQSRAWALAGVTPGLRNVLVRVWIESWEQIPMGSLPDDDQVIAALIEYPMGMFAEHRATLMSGWWKASDGRYYHPYETELVLGRLAHVNAEAERKAKWREKRATQEADPKRADVVSHGTNRPGTRNDDAGAGAGAGAGAVGSGVALVGAVSDSGATVADSRELTLTPPTVGEKKPQTKRTRCRLQAIEILDFLNQKAGRYFQAKDATLAPIVARLQEGFTEEDLRAVVALKCREWLKDPKASGWLRPKTLFGAENFAQYIGCIRPERVDAVR